MIAIKLKNVSICSGSKFRNNQNYTLTLWRHSHLVDENTTIENVKSRIEDYFPNVKLNTRSIVTIESNSYIKVEKPSKAEMRDKKFCKI